MNLLLLNILRNGGGGSPAPTFEWNDMPEAAFTPTTTLTYSGSGGVNSAAISGHTDIGLDGVWNRMRADGLVGSEGTPIRFVNIDAATQIGNRLHADWENWLCIDSINGSTFVEFWGKSITEPLWLDGNDNGGFAWIGGASNSTIKGYNLLITEQGWASIFMNSDNGYAYIEIIGSKNFGADDDGEVTYLGTTTKSDALGVIQKSYLKDIMGYSRGRDGNQMNNQAEMLIDGITVHNVGILNMSGQRALVQYQNSRGIVKNGIFHDAPNAGVICGHGLVFFNNYYKWNSGDLIHQDISTEYSAVTDAAKLPGRNYLPVFYIECDFAPDTAGCYINVQDSLSDIIAIDCNLNSNIGSGLFDDNRSDTGTFSLQVINATTGATIPVPTYTNWTPTDYENSGKCTEAYHYGKARGFATKDSRKRPVPEFEILSVSSVSGITANEGTPFEDLNLPIVVQVTIDSDILDSPINVKLPVTWAEGSYDPDVQATYELTGTFNLPSWYIIKNTSALTASIDVEVIEPVFNPFTDIAWVAAFDPTNYDGTAGTWTNQGSGGNASQGSATTFPAKLSSQPTASGFGLQFVNGSGTGLQYGTGTVTEPYETWIEIVTPASFSGTQRIYANGNAARVTVNASGQVLVGGNGDVSTGLTLSPNTYYLLRIVNNGASSSITANNGTPLTFTITAQNGSSTPKLGHAYSAGSGHWTGTMGLFCQKSTELSGGEITNMWSYGGF